MRGRKPLPTALHVLQGTARADRQNVDEIKPKPSSGRCPRYLDGDARVAWYKLAPELVRLRVLTRLDELWLESTCEAYAFWRANRTAAAFAVWRSLLAEGGLTPSSRTRIAVASGEQGDLFDEMYPAAGGAR